MEKLLHERLREWANKADERGEYALTLAIEDMNLHNGKYREAESKLLHAFADEIERCYRPLPRFKTGETCQKGSETAWGTVGGMAVYTDSSWTLNDEYGNELASGESNDFVEPPDPKTLDADGVEIKVGDTVWELEHGYEFSAVEVEQDRIRVKHHSVTAYEMHYQPSQLTHEKPVFDAEGVRICKGDTVYTKNGESAEVVSIHDENEWPTLGGKAGKPFVRYAGDGWNFADEVSHREPDSLVKLRDDIYSNATNSPALFTIKSWADRLTALIERDA